MTDSAIEAAARAICRRRLVINQERSQISPLSEGDVDSAVDSAWTDYEDDARVALEAAYPVIREVQARPGRRRSTSIDGVEASQLSEDPEALF